MLIVQLSDTHLAGPGQKTFGVAAMAENLARCVEHINRLQPQPAWVLHTGDVTSDGRVEEAQRAAEILSRLDAPLAVVPGNHDRRNTLAAAFGPQICPRDAHGFIQHDITLPGLRLLGLDTVAAEGPGGAFDPRRAAWLDARLREAPHTPTVLFMHHPPARLGVIETDVDGFEGADLLAEVLSGHPQVFRILAGHIHLSSFAEWQSRTISTAPSTGMRLYLDLTLSLSRYILDEPAYHLHLAVPEKPALVTHTVRVLADEPLHPFAPET